MNNVNGAAVDLDIFGMNGKIRYTSIFSYKMTNSSLSLPLKILEVSKVGAVASGEGALRWVKLSLLHSNRPPQTTDTSISSKRISLGEQPCAFLFYHERDAFYKLRSKGDFSVVLLLSPQMNSSQSSHKKLIHIFSGKTVPSP